MDFILLTAQVALPSVPTLLTFPAWKSTKVVKTVIDMQLVYSFGTR
ncbi:hypothetical protein [Pontibacillus halophilus]|nr:hypothetical protein [Pontibacillus halophilus]